MDKEFFKRRLDDLRRERGWSKCQLNDEAGFSAGMIYQWYNTNRMPTVSNLEMICKACDITLAQFFAEDGQDAEQIADREFMRLYNKLSLDEKVFVREVIEKLLKLTKKNDGYLNE